MRQRFDAVGEQWNIAIKEEIVNLLNQNRLRFGKIAVRQICKQSSCTDTGHNGI